MEKQETPLTNLPQYPESYWLSSASIPSFPKLTKDIQVDVAIVGAGITGITTAYLLSKQGLKVALIEAGLIMNGTTGHTTAKITAQHGLIYNEFLTQFGEEQTKLYYDANIEALQFIKHTIDEQQLSCDFIEQDAYVYTHSDQYVKQIKAEAEAYKTLGIPGEYLEQTPLPFPVKAAVVMRNQAQYNPIPFLTHLIQEVVNQGGQVFENTTAVSLELGDAPTVSSRDGHKVVCKDVISCSHFPFYDGSELYFSRIHSDRSYVLAVKMDQEYPGGMYITAESPNRTLRSALIHGEKMVLVSGESHKTGEGICTFKHYEALKAYAEENLGIKEISYRWSAQDLVTLDRIPYIGKSQSDKPHYFVATGYKKWGMTSGIAAALLLEKIVLGKESPYQELFRPDRFHVNPSVKNFVVQNADVAKHFVAGKLGMVHKEPGELGNDEGAVVSVNGKRAGAYRDTHGELHLVDTTCRHMGCEVEWNAAERTWDCPCHGSRYSYQGEVVEGPAFKPLKPLTL